ncbi:hypothetical protein ACTPEF_23990, partial [Clostridioides difficile]
STSNMVFSPKVTCPLDLSTFTGIPLFLKVSSTEALTFLAKSCQEIPISRYKFKEFKTIFLKSLRKVL